MQCLTVGGVDKNIDKFFSHIRSNDCFLFVKTIQHWNTNLPLTQYMFSKISCKCSNLTKFDREQFQTISYIETFFLLSCVFVNLRKSYQKKTVNLSYNDFNTKLLFKKPLKLQFNWLVWKKEVDLCLILVVKT